MKTFFTVLALTAASVTALTEDELNVVDMSLRCVEDTDCRPEDLDYITGQG